MRRSRPSRFLLFILFIVAGFLVIKTCKSIPSFTNFLKAKPVTIDETPILVKEIKTIGQLITAAATDEIVIESTIPTPGSSFVNSVNRLSPFRILPSADKHIVLIGKGKVLAGTNMGNLQENNVRTSGDTVWATIPKAIIIDAIMNPSDFETFEEKGTWTSEEIIPVKTAARQKMIDRALQHNILQTADNKAKAILQQFLSAAGYKIVYVNFE